jgi:asparagine synthase (glutamine-hydrolysing)
MCGIAGIYNLNNQPIDQKILREMLEIIKHRGPDDEGIFIDKNLGIGNKRLAIIDLSEAGHQPMSSEDKTLWIVYNGEIYNFIELRRELKKRGYRFRSNSDTEVILNSYKEWGSNCLDKFNGMWSFVIWDDKKKQLFCARDRFGIKPFYYYFNGKNFAFTSEIKALLKCPFIKREPNEKLIYDYLNFGIVDHTNESFFAGIKQLEPGHFLIVSSKNGLINREYYQISFNQEIGKFDKNKHREYTQKFLQLLKTSIKMRLRSDVPVGSCLSGGLDSSTIVFLINRLLQEERINKEIIGEQQRTFTSSYEDLRFDERKYVQKVIEDTRAKPHFVFPNGKGLWQELDQLIWQQEEPFNSTSVYAQWNVMRLAKQNNVKVLLDGQGADETLAGYLPYFGSFLNQLFFSGKYITYLKELESVARVGLLSKKEAVFYQLKELFLIFPQSLRKIIKQKSSLLNQNFDKKYKERENQQIRDISKFNLSKHLLYDTTKTGLRALLRYEDKNSMAFSIETRLPFLDYRLIEFVFSLPAVYKIHNGWSKYLLRSAVGNLLPREISWRRDKMGFVTPEIIWLKENKGEIKKIFSEKRFMSDIYVNRKKILDDLDNFFKKEVGTSELWRLINLELWLRKFMT